MKHLTTILLIGITTGVTIFALSSIEPIRDWLQQLNANADSSCAGENGDAVMPPTLVVPSHLLPARDVVAVPEIVVATPAEVASTEFYDSIATSNDASVAKEVSTLSLKPIASELNIEPKSIRGDVEAKGGSVKPSQSKPTPEEGFKRLNTNLSAMGDALAEFNEKLKERMKR